MSDFKTTHKLDFMVSDYPDILQLLEVGEPKWMLFKVGTCEGLWRCYKGFYEILAIDNKVLNNGHFQDTMQWFEESCRRDKLGLKFLAVMNARFLQHLTNKKGFKMEKINDEINCYKNEF